jgi:predicted nucleotidyltransferase
MAESNLEHLNPTERQALAAFIRRLRERFDGGLQSAQLFGSRARGEGSPGSDLDVLVVVDSEDWRVHKEIRYLAADICLEYGLELSPRVWSTSHLQEMEQLQGHLYLNIQRDGISLSE